MADNIIRQSQLITTYGPGAMIDLPDYSVIVSGLDDWAHSRREKIEEPRLVAKLKRLLDVPTLELYTPPRHEANSTQPAPVGARIFPTWFIVKDARQSPVNPQWRRRRLVRWTHLNGQRRFVDEYNKRQPVVPVRLFRVVVGATLTISTGGDLYIRELIHANGLYGWRSEAPAATSSTPLAYAIVVPNGLSAKHSVLSRGLSVLAAVCDRGLAYMPGKNVMKRIDYWCAPPAMLTFLK